jgi:phage tail-like protein
MESRIMTKFSANPTRFDPYRNFKFRVKWDGRYVAGVSKASSLKATTESVKHREGGDPATARKVPGLRKPGTVTLKRGITLDREFERWARRAQVDSSGGAPKQALKNLRRDVTIEVYNEAGRLALAYKLRGCWVSEIQALPDLDAKANGVAIESIKLEHEGLERVDIVK